MRGERRRPTPSLNDSLHERNRYRFNAPDFYALGQLYPTFRAVLVNINDKKGTASLPWDSPLAVRELTKTLLLHDFGLKWTIPLDRLCPPVPNRLNYIHWIEDLLEEAGVAYHDTQQHPIKGIDIGTGASCIYPLLGAALHGWKFLATEIDATSAAAAVENVRVNGLESVIEVKRTKSNALLSEPLRGLSDTEGFHFCMCNPPFFGDISEADSNPDACYMGTMGEMVFPGGEVAFIKLLIDESKLKRDQLIWFTSMVGRKTSLRKILALLREAKVAHMRTTEFMQGRTKRWGVAWTYRELIKPSSHAKVLGKRKELQRRTSLEFVVPEYSEQDPQGCASLDEVADRCRAFCDEVELKWKKVEKAKDVEKQTFLWHGGGCVGKVLVERTALDFAVTINYREGDRAVFWRLADQLQGAVKRSSRQWRRKMARTGQVTD